MPGELQVVVCSTAAAAAVALIVAWVLRTTLPAKLAERFGLPAAVAAGFFAGYLLLPEWAALVPQRHWQWLPWLGIAAILAGRSTPPSFVSWIAWAVLAAASAWLLTPTWATLWPPRLVTIPLLAVYLGALITLLAALPERLVGRLFVGTLTAAGLTAALMITVGVSVKTGQIALLAPAALAGCWAVTLIPTKHPAAKEPPNFATRSLIPAFVVLVGGLAFVGTIEPKAPLPIILLAPAEPLTLWLFAAGPLAKVQGWKSAVLQVAAVVLPLIVALAYVAQAN